MRPSLKRNIITSKTTGRRYYLGRSNGRRYYVCSKSDCEESLLKESDIFCPMHSQIEQSNDVNDNIVHEHNEIINETFNEVEQNDSSITEDNLNNTIPLSSRQKKKANREIHVDEITGKRTFRDESGRCRYLCTHPSCTNMLKRQTDEFCYTHSNNEKKTTTDNQTRYSAPPLSNQPEEQNCSSLSTTSPLPPPIDKNDTNGNHSDEYEPPQSSSTTSTPTQKNIEITETTRSFRDASGKIRFLCLNPTCTSRLVRRADIFCKRHQIKENNNTNGNKEENKIENMDVNHNNPNTPSHQIPSEPPIKKRKHEIEPTISKISNLSAIPANKMVISTTILLESQWNDILTFLRQYPDVQLSTNLNVNNFTTHLLVDDSEHLLHCTITKKIVQAAVRRHIFIISSRWINDCINSNKFLSEYSYEIQSDSHTTLRLSTLTSSYLFHKTYGFAIECRQCQGSINRNELIELIELTGAKFYDNDNNHIDILIVLCDTNEKNLNKIKEKYSQTNIKNIKYVTSDFLLKSIIKFEIQDIDKYSL